MNIDILVYNPGMYKEIMNSENAAFDKSKTLSQKDKELISKVFESANLIHDSFLLLPRFHNLANFAIAATKRNSAFIKVEAIGNKVGEGNISAARTHAHLERHRIEVGPDTGTIYDGTLHANDFVISVSGAGEMSIPVAIGALVGAKIINYDDAESLARKYGCLSNYSENETVITGGFFGKIPTLANPLLPDQDISNPSKKSSE